MQNSMSLKYEPASEPLHISDVRTWQVSTGSVWYHEESDESPKLRHLEVLYPSNGTTFSGMPEKVGHA